MNDGTENATSWLALIGDRAEVGRAIVRLSRLAVVAHRFDHASAEGPAESPVGRLTTIAPAHTEVPR